MKVLILENVDHLDQDFSYFVSKEYEKDEVKIVYSLSNIENDESLYKELIENLMWADKISICTTLDVNVDKILPLIVKHKNITDIDIRYLYSNNERLRLCKTLNGEKNELIFDLITNRNVREVFINTYTVDTNKDSFFEKHVYTYATVPLVYIKKHDCIWHKERVHVPDLNDFLYDLAGEKEEEVKPKIGKTFEIEEKDILQFDSLIDETKAYVNYQLESLMLSPDFGDSVELRQEKNAWLNILSKYF